VDTRSAEVLGSHRRSVALGDVGEREEVKLMHIFHKWEIMSAQTAIEGDALINNATRIVTLILFGCTKCSARKVESVLGHWILQQFVRKHEKGT